MRAKFIVLATIMCSCSSPTETPPPGGVTCGEGTVLRDGVCVGETDSAGGDRDGESIEDSMADSVADSTLIDATSADGIAETLHDATYEAADGARDDADAEPGETFSDSASSDSAIDATTLDASDTALEVGADAAGSDAQDSTVVTGDADASVDASLTDAADDADTLVSADTAASDTYEPAVDAGGDTFLADTYEASVDAESADTSSCPPNYYRLEGSVACGKLTSTQTFGYVSVGFDVYFPNGVADDDQVMVKGLGSTDNTVFQCGITKVGGFTSIVGMTYVASYEFLPNRWYRVECVRTVTKVFISVDGGSIINNGAPVWSPKTIESMQIISTTASTKKDFFIKNVLVSNETGTVFNLPVNEGTGNTLFESSGKGSVFCYPTTSTDRLSWGDPACL